MYYLIVFVSGLCHNFFEYYLANSIVNWEKFKIIYSFLLISVYVYFNMYYIMYYPSLSYIGCNLYIISIALGKLFYFVHFRYKNNIINIFNNRGINFFKKIK